ncbi:hypothetical protein F3N42_03730 [Marinihelvus fidelis]|uniref:DUF1508 domain-containing protein n=1 Tax=Marinihelvus fidelis TaxID=2613842 RepID=A0A5N0TEL3_9GAMM|nr:hypothetical protein [Marinihelvus fidelis]KAA9133472.1 hypothetical protein F3N42_03730 [Marinihelvus fidelis]
MSAEKDQAMLAHFELTQDDSGNWFWVFRSTAGHVMARSAVPHHSKRAAAEHFNETAHEFCEFVRKVNEAFAASLAEEEGGNC